jgi:hypothetical protein
MTFHLLQSEDCSAVDTEFVLLYEICLLAVGSSLAGRFDPFHRSSDILPLNDTKHLLPNAVPRLSQGRRIERHPVFVSFAFPVDQNKKKGGCS